MNRLGHPQPAPMLGFESVRLGAITETVSQPIRSLVSLSRLREGIVVFRFLHFDFTSDFSFGD